MRVDTLAVQLRPRTMREASDLGVRMVQVHAAAVWSAFAPAWALVAILAVASGALADWLPPVVIFWLKPWLDRSVLFVLARAVFGTPTRFIDLWRARRQVFWAQLLPTLTTRRLSPWRSYLAPAQQLEGQHGAAAAARQAQLLRGTRGAALGMHGVFANFESLLTVGVLATGFLLMPGTGPVSSWDLVLPTEHAGAWSLAFVWAYAGAVCLLEPFYVGAGFAMYLNRRVELEAWDIEQEFRLVFPA